MMQLRFLSLFCLWMLTGKLILAAPSFRSASFIPPASPLIVGDTSSAAPTPTILARSKAVEAGYGLYPKKRKLTLFAKKKSASAAKKVQVRLLEHIEGTGRAGDVVMVSRAMYVNRLRPSGAAEEFSDEQLALEKAEAVAKAAQLEQAAQHLQEHYAKSPIKFSRKAGEDGRLFGAIGPKQIVQEVKMNPVCKGLNLKHIKVLTLEDMDGSMIRGDIKTVGSFKAVVSVGQSISANVDVIVNANS